MILEIRNSWYYRGKYRGHRQWRSWTVFFNGGGLVELSKIDFIEYVLHSTFPDLIRKITDPEGDVGSDDMIAAHVENE